ncbi:hypothetical protein U27_01435 [Candidatus Vecturithrix granuli]|uniref:Uncharacterized protein n=1 Tax=Vecturithrix granuli TaxID=1499967 RepID=A0A081CAC9_VECG1|nr:hypothetical protein U27_01435 [Candidatus Vecturithrix granuli]
MKTLIKPWKGLKLFAFGRVSAVQDGENPNKTLEGIKTICGFHHERNNPGENPNKTLEGIKTLLTKGLLSRCLSGENPNKTLEGIKTFLPHHLTSILANK